MSNEPGDRRTGHGDHGTYYNYSGADIDAGYWVAPSAEDEVALSDTNGLVGVSADPIPDGGYGNVHMRGAVYARVDSGVTAGDELAVPESGATGESAGVAESGGSSGHFALTDAQAADDGGDDYALVLLR